VGSRRWPARSRSMGKVAPRKSGGGKPVERAQQEGKKESLRAQGRWASSGGTAATGTSSLDLVQKPEVIRPVIRAR